MWNQSCRIQNFHRWSSTNGQNRLSTRRRPSCLFRQGRLDVLERFGQGSSFATDRHLFLLFRTLKKSHTETSDERLKINKNIFSTWYDSRQAKNEFFSHFLICLNSDWAYAFYIFFLKRLAFIPVNIASKRLMNHVFTILQILIIKRSTGPDRSFAKFHQFKLWKRLQIMTGLGYEPDLQKHLD